MFTKKVTGRVVFNYTDSNYKEFIIMQFREDGKLGFVGGKIEKDDLISGLKREVFEEIGFNKIDDKRLELLQKQEDERYISYTYIYKITEKELKDIMMNQVKAEHFRIETFGLILVPVSTYLINGYGETFLQDKITSYIRNEYKSVLEVIKKR